MPQGPIAVYDGSLGGNKSALNVTAPAVIKATPGRIVRIVILGVVGTGGAITVNDCTTTAAAATSNQIFTITGTTAVGTVINLDFPCLSGIVVSAVPSGGTPRLAISFD